MTDPPASEDAGDAKERTKEPKINWDDPSTPAGNAPPMPRWPLIASAVVFSAWLVFLVAMAVLRIRTTAY